MKKIIFTVINDLNYDQRMIRICGTLQEHGYSCLLVGRRLPSSLPLSQTTYSQKRLRCFFNKGKLFYLEYNFRLFWYLLFKKCAGICSIDVDTALPGLWVCRIRGKKHIFDAHELFTHVPEVVNRPRVQKIWEKVQGYAFKNTGLAYTVGTEIAGYFEERYHTKVHVIRNIPSFKNKLPYKPDKDKFILYQGALNKGRGLEELITAMKELDCKLVLAGEGDLSAQLKDLTRKLGLEHKVQFLGYVMPKELPKLTARAWIGMNTSRNEGLSYYLSLNNKFFDYVHAGLPSLLNPFPEYLTLNNEFGVGVITDPVVSDIVKNAKQLLEDEALHARLHEGCERAAQELNWEKEALHLTALYDRYFEK